MSYSAHSLEAATFVGTFLEVYIYIYISFLTAPVVTE
jgi:hypothetical protein